MRKLVFYFSRFITRSRSVTEKTMSRILCTISGQPTEDPVVSPVSGAIFDKTLITKYIEEYGKDPSNEAELTKEQLIPVQLNNHISETLRPQTASIPALLKSLQNEWEVNMIYTFRIRRELQRARQELSHALYRNDASVRTISRLTAQLTAARSALAGMERPDPVTAMETNADDELGLDKELIDKVDARAEELSQSRRVRTKEAQANNARIEDIEKMELASENKNLHDSTPAGITCLDVQENVTATGGNDKKVVLYNIENDTVEATFTGHKKKISKVLLLPDQETVVSGSFDTQIRVWKKANEAPVAVFKHHDGAITDLSLHPLGTHFLSVSTDGLWSFNDLTAGKTTLKKDMYKYLPQPPSANAYAFGSGKVHPDGILMGMGTAGGVLYVWDIREQSVAAEFPDHGSQVTSIAFSENGYHLAAGTANGLLKMWDLRKLNCFKTIELSNSEVKQVSFDYGTYLATASGTTAKVFHLKSWKETNAFDHDDIVTDIRFGSNAQSLLTTSLDRKLRRFVIP